MHQFTVYLANNLSEIIELCLITFHSNIKLFELYLQRKKQDKKINPTATITKMFHDSFSCQLKRKFFREINIVKIFPF